MDIICNIMHLYCIGFTVNISCLHFTLQIDRIRYVLSSYLRERLKKVLF